MDLSKYDLPGNAEAGAECVLRDPISGEPTDAAITVLGQDARGYRKARREMVDALLKRAANSDVAEEGDLRSAEALAATTTGWRRVELDGVLLEFSRENAVKLYTHPRCGWVVEQLEAFAAKRSNFSKG